MKRQIENEVETKYNLIDVNELNDVSIDNAKNNKI